MTLHPTTADTPSATLPALSPAPLEEILCTDELWRRPRREPDYETENRALMKLVDGLASSPATILQTLADVLLDIFKADSAGLSLLTEDEDRFYWPAIAGKWQPHIGGGTPRNFGPCGDVLDCNAPLLFRQWERRYPYLLEVAPLAEEALLVPFSVRGKAVGTIWTIAHNGRRRFDAEDLRQLENFGRFASAAYQAVELQKAEDSRRVALERMEAAVRARLEIEALNKALSERERQSRELLEAIPAAIYTTDAEGRITFFNKAAADLSGRVPRLGQDKWCISWQLHSPDGRRMAHEDCPMALALQQKRAIRGVEIVVERPDGRRVPVLPFPTPLFDDEGKLVSAINVLVDISERRRTEHQLRQIIEELNHRVKNTLATVQSMAASTARYTESIDEFRVCFEARLLALSRAHSLLTERKWSGAELRKIIELELAAFETGEPARVQISGPEVELPPRMALALSMIFHELATNAAKYGSLSNGEGRVFIGWERIPNGAVDHLNLQWLESAGPAVTAPARRGFGTRFVDRTLAYDLGAEGGLVFEPGGLQLHARIPLPG